MDILNFISWIRGGRQVTSVDPDKTLVPIGIKDSRRDDGYLAAAITVSDLANYICSGFDLPYAIAMVGPNGGGLEDTRAYYSDRDLQNIAGQCADPSLAIGAKFYLDNQFTTPAADGTYAALDPDAILFGLIYVVTNGIITNVLCP